MNFSRETIENISLSVVGRSLSLVCSSVPFSLVDSTATSLVGFSFALVDSAVLQANSFHTSLSDSVHFDVVGATCHRRRSVAALPRRRKAGVVESCPTGGGGAGKGSCGRQKPGGFRRRRRSNDGAGPRVRSMRVFVDGRRPPVVAMAIAAGGVGCGGRSSTDEMNSITLAQISAASPEAELLTVGRVLEAVDEARLGDETGGDGAGEQQEESSAAGSAVAAAGAAAATSAGAAPTGVLLLHVST